MPGPAAATSAISARAGLSHVPRVDGYRLGPSQKKAARQHQTDQRDDDGTEQIDMRQGIHW